MARSDKARFSRNAKPQLLAEYFHGQQGMTRQKRLALVIGMEADENECDFVPSFMLDDDEIYQYDCESFDNSWDDEGDDDGWDEVWERLHEEDECWAVYERLVREARADQFSY